MAYTRHVAGRRHAAILAALSCLPAICVPAICVPAMAHAGVPLKLVPHLTYSVTYSAFTNSAKDISAEDIVAGRPASNSLGGWEVTAEFDPIRCEVYCIYRQKPDAYGRTPLVSLLAPPIAIVEVYTGPASKPRIVVFDPAGLGLPSATSQKLGSQERLCLPGRKFAPAVPSAQISGTRVSHQAPVLPWSSVPDLTVNSITPLRI